VPVRRHLSGCEAVAKAGRASPTVDERGPPLQIGHMRLLTTSVSLASTFRQLIARHETLSFAVAWASHDFSGYDELLARLKR
jgi:hypothetical protein